MAMFRSSSSYAVVLKKVRVGEIHKSLTLLTPTKGIIQALAHGACKIKSRLRTPSEPFSYIKVYLYHEPVKDQYKVTDIESIDLFEGIRKSLSRYYTASLFAEIVLKSFGGGESYKSLYRLLLYSLECLDKLPENRVLMVTLQFLIRFLILSGYSLEFETCDNCGKHFDANDPGFFSNRDMSRHCANCAGSDSIEISAGARRYMVKTPELPFTKAVMIGLDDGSVIALKDLLYQFIQGPLEMHLNSIQCSAGII